MVAAADVTADVLVIGAGLAGSATAIRLAQAGAKVIVVEPTSPTESTPPSARGGLVLATGVRSLIDLGVDAERLGRPISNVCLNAERSLKRPLPTVGQTSNRIIDDALLKSTIREHLASALAPSRGELWSGWSAQTPSIERGFLRGATVTDIGGSAQRIRSAYTVIADGANSTFGRALGTFRRRAWPFAVSAGSIWASPDSEADHIEVSLDLVDSARVPITGFGWVLPRGDGTVGVGITVLSTAPSFQVLTADRVLGDFVASCRERWQLGDQPLVGMREGRQPLGNSVAPVGGPTFLVVGDAGGFGNPLIGTGTDTALSSGIIASRVIAEALADGSSAPLQRYARAIGERTAGPYKVGRLSARMLGQPAVMRQVADVLTRSSRAADIFLRVATGDLRSRGLGVAEMTYRTTRALSILAPDA